MPNHRAEIKRLEKKVDALSDALAHLGKGTSLRDLILIMRKPGWTTPAELTFATSIIETMAEQVAGLERLQNNLLKGSRMVGAEVGADLQADMEESVAS